MNNLIMLILMIGLPLLVVAVLVWLIIATGKYANDAMDDIMDHERHNYKSTERKL